MVPPASETLADSWGTGGGRGRGGRSEFNREKFKGEIMGKGERSVVGKKKVFDIAWEAMCA